MSRNRRESKAFEERIRLHKVGGCEAFFISASEGASGFHEETRIDLYYQFPVGLEVPPDLKLHKIEDQDRLVKVGSFGPWAFRTWARRFRRGSDPDLEDVLSFLVGTLHRWLSETPKLGRTPIGSAPGPTPGQDWERRLQKALESGMWKTGFGDLRNAVRRLLHSRLHAREFPRPIPVRSSAACLARLVLATLGLPAQVLDERGIGVALLLSVALDRQSAVRRILSSRFHLRSPSPAEILEILKILCNSALADLDPDGKPANGASKLLSVAQTIERSPWWALLTDHLRDKVLIAIAVRTGAFNEKKITGELLDALRRGGYLHRMELVCALMHYRSPAAAKARGQATVSAGPSEVPRGYAQGLADLARVIETHADSRMALAGWADRHGRPAEEILYDLVYGRLSEPGGETIQFVPIRAVLATIREVGEAEWLALIGVFDDGAAYGDPGFRASNLADRCERIRKRTAAARLALVATRTALRECIRILEAVDTRDGERIREMLHQERRGLSSRIASLVLPSRTTGSAGEAGSRRRAAAARIDQDPDAIDAEQVTKQEEVLNAPGPRIWTPARVREGMNAIREVLGFEQAASG
jgi:hypothetical protein